MLIPYPAVFPMDEATILLTATAGKTAAADVIHAAYEMLGFALGRVLPITVPAQAFPAETVQARKTYSMVRGSADRAAAESDLRQLLATFKAGDGTNPALKGSWLSEAFNRIVFLCQQLIAEWWPAPAPAVPVV